VGLYTASGLHRINVLSGTLNKNVHTTYIQRTYNSYTVRDDSKQGGKWTWFLFDIISGTLLRFCLMFCLEHIISGTLLRFCLMTVRKVVMLPLSV
jgi:hypothetical protein